MCYDFNAASPSLSVCWDGFSHFLLMMLQCQAYLYAKINIATLCNVTFFKEGDFLFLFWPFLIFSFRPNQFQTE